MGLAAAEHIRKNFTFNRQLTETIEMYNRLTKPGRPVPV
jgi:hypothetical protein